MSAMTRYPALSSDPVPSHFIHGPVGRVLVRRADSPIEHTPGEPALLERLDEIAKRHGHDQGHIPGTPPEFRQHVERARKSLVVAHHGPFTWGRNPTDALENHVALEACAKMAFGAHCLNPHAAAIPDYLLDKHFLRKHGPDAYYGQRPEAES